MVPAQISRERIRLAHLRPGIHPWAKGMSCGQWDCLAQSHSGPPHRRRVRGEAGLGVSGLSSGDVSSPLRDPLLILFNWNKSQIFFPPLGSLCYISMTMRDQVCRVRRWHKACQVECGPHVNWFCLWSFQQLKSCGWLFLTNVSPVGGLVSPFLSTFRTREMIGLDQEQFRNRVGNRHQALKGPWKVWKWA